LIERQIPSENECQIRVDYRQKQIKVNLEDIRKGQYYTLLHRLKPEFARGNIKNTIKLLKVGLNDIPKNQGVKRASYNSFIALLFAEIGDRDNASSYYNSALRFWRRLAGFDWARTKRKSLFYQYVLKATLAAS
jgi:hypothetical protein